VVTTPPIRWPASSHARRSTAGGDGAALAVLAPLLLLRQPNGSLDLGATMERLSALVEAGVTDVLAHVRVPDSYAGA
jgi:hypothetical protein